MKIALGSLGPFRLKVSSKNIQRRPNPSTSRVLRISRGSFTSYVLFTCSLQGIIYTYKGCTCKGKGLYTFLGTFFGAYDYMDTFSSDPFSQRFTVEKLSINVKTQVKGPKLSHFLRLFDGEKGSKMPRFGKAYSKFWGFFHSSSQRKKRKFFGGLFFEWIEGMRRKWFELPIKTVACPSIPSCTKEPTILSIEYNVI